jgi:hypothetical protein
MEKHEKLTPNMIEKMNRVIPEARRHLSQAFRSELKVDRGGAGLDFGQPLPSASDRSDELVSGIGADRAGFGL